jgi:(1->4)-alpha-D-glucan 1-alpha-D-glucosylmutase
MIQSSDCVPRATMRLQLHKDFTFADAARTVPYLASLGISHLYSSPILTARAGSIHGYDVIDPSQVNPELGGELGLQTLVGALREAGLGLIVDVVPNHMAVGDDNFWWNEVLRDGATSRFASYFDIDWYPDDPALQGKVLAPFLGTPYGEALASGDLQLDWQNDTPVIRYFDATFPIDPKTWAGQADSKAMFDTAEAAGRARLHELLERQHYRLAWWGTAGDEINWRRFFDINGLVGVRIDRPEVFEATHATLFRLYSEGLIDGMRVDHVDGLADPPAYCRRLRARLSELEGLRPDHAPSGPAYLVVEKILGAEEPMPTDWKVDGSSGYDFMDTVNALQHDPTAEPALAALWATISGRSAEFRTEETRARLEIVTSNFHAQLEAVAATLHEIARLDLTTRDMSHAAIRRGLLALLTHFPVYRLYGSGQKRSVSDDTAFQKAMAAAKADSPPALHPVLDRIDIWLGGQLPPLDAGGLYRLAFTRYQQLSAPVAAKAVEDTAFYRYGRLLSRNDVGFDAELLGIEPDAFHVACKARAVEFPQALLATATHDHKRGEDVRSRLAVLSEIPAEWEVAVTRWRQLNLPHRQRSDPALFSAGDEAILYQMIIGAWPNELLPSDRAGCDLFTTRLAAWQEKALREAKLRTDWTKPNLAYEAAARDFLGAILGEDSHFLAEAANLARRIGPAGAVNGLAQTVLKLTAPGVPDFFQGTEFWDFSLVDPDNRRPVDFDARIRALSAAAEPQELAGQWRDGRIKQAVIARALGARRKAPNAFTHGTYTPIAVTGPGARHVIAFLRSHEAHQFLVVVPRLPGRLLDGSDTIIIPPDRWADTRLKLPEGLASAKLRDIFTGTVLAEDRALIPVGKILGSLPIALLHVAS